MKIRINGKEVEVSDAVSVSDLLVAQQVKMPSMVSVELNGEILDRSAFGTTVIKENDGVEFLYFMGGGNITAYPMRRGEGKKRHESDRTTD